MFCTNCGNEIGEGKKFCTNCGTPVKHASSHAAPVEFALSKFIADGLRWVGSLNKKWLAIGVGMVVLIPLIFIYYPKNSGGTQNIQRSVVDILCDTGYGGSGTIFTNDGTVLTNNHVIEGATVCQVTIPDPATGGISEVYNAAPVIVPKLSKKYDVATLKIDGAYTDSTGKTWGTYPATFQAFSLPRSCNPSSPSKLGDSVRIYGYPVTSGGYNLTITDGVISSFADDGNILTSAQIDSGNSGGLAVDQNGCWLGIPSAVVSGNYQNLGVIIPGDIVETLFLNTVPAKVNPVASNESAKSSTESATTPQKTNDQICQDTYGIYSEWSGKMSSSGNPTCGCQSGYSWSGTGDSCASQTVLNQWCVNNYGSGSYSTPQDGEAVCDCQSGYTMNSGGTACVVAQKSYSQQCQDVYGTYSEWSGKIDSNGKPTCGCQTGYSWDGSGNFCATQISLQQECQTAYGSGSYSHPQNGKAVCDCSTGYAWNAGQTMCVVELTPTQVCQRDVGPSSYYLGYNNANGTYACSNSY